MPFIFEIYFGQLEAHENTSRLETGIFSAVLIRYRKNKVDVVAGANLGKIENRVS